MDRSLSEMSEEEAKARLDDMRIAGSEPMDEHIGFIDIPKPVGAYVVGAARYGDFKYQGLHIDMLHKPNWLHRSMMRWFFGWVWVDADR